MYPYLDANSQSLALGGESTGSAEIYFSPVANNNSWFNVTGGNLGIGTSKPIQKLDVNGDIVIRGGDIMNTSGASIIALNNSTKDVTFGNNVAIPGNLTVDTLALYVSASTNNVGIGSTSPAYRLDVNAGTIAGATGTGINTYADAASGIGYLGYHMTLYNSTANASGYLRLARTSGTNYLGMEIGSQSRDGIRFLTGASTPLEVMRIKADGNVGIGTTNPGAKLEIGGSTSTISNTSGDITINSASGIVSYSSDSISNVANIYITGNLGVGLTNPAQELDVRGDIQLDANGSATTNGLCHSGSDSDTTFNDRDIVACSAAPGDIAEWYDTKDGEQGDIVATTGDTITYTSPMFNARTGESIPQTQRITASVLEKTKNRYQTNALGIISTSPYQSFGKAIIDYARNPNPIALVGRVPLKISNINGVINTGDPITTSDIPGMGMKATKPGQIVAIALQDSSGGESISCPEGFGQYDCRKINAFVKLGWYDPDVLRSDTNSLQLTNIDMFGNSIVVDSSTGKTIDRIGAFADTVTGKFKAGFATITNLVTDNLTARGKIITPLAEINNLKTKEIAPLSDGEDIRIKLSDLPATENSPAKDSKFQIINSQDIPIASIDSSGNATFAGEIDAQSASISGSLEAEEIRAKKIIADEIVGLEGKFGNLVTSTISATYITQNITQYIQPTLSPTPTPSIELSPPATESGFTNTDIEQMIQEILETASEATPQASLGNVTDDELQVRQSLSVLGTTSLANTTIAGTLNIGGSVLIADGTINTTASPLYIQNLGMAGVDILGGKIVINASGDVTIENNVTIQGRLALKDIVPLPDNDITINLSPSSTESSRLASLLIKGPEDKIVASIDASGSATFAKVNIIADAQASPPVITAESPETNATAGEAVLATGQTEVTIKSALITEKSLIYVTPTTDTSNKVLFIKGKKATDAVDIGWFKIGIDAALPTEIKFNWWIIN